VSGAARPIWRFSWPAQAHPERPLALYGRGPIRIGDDGALELAGGATVSFDTYFNAFDVAKWWRHTAVRDLSLAARGSGGVRLEVVHRAVEGTERIVGDGSFERDETAALELALPRIDELRTGHLVLRATAAGRCARLEAVRWETRDEPTQDVRLGLVVTTYQRRDDVRSNLGALHAALGREPALRDLVEIVVVDNGRSLGPADVGGERVTLLPNRNVGGAGGFARGLMHLRAEGRATHALFMDDDVSFDPDLVFRVLDVLAYASDPQLCIAGAMLEREQPTCMVEAGARFFGRSLDANRPIGNGLRVDRWDAVVRAGAEREPIDYGAWWCFAFPVSLTRDNPLPVFMRGDDVAWGVMHARGHIATFPGIGLWHDGFEHKVGPVARFYETRNLALISCLSVPGYSWRHLLLRYLNLCARSLFGLQYATAGHVTWATREFLAGPARLLALDHAALHAAVSDFDGERVAALPPDLEVVPDIPRLRGVRRAAAVLASLLVLGGHLLPARFARRPVRGVQLGERPVGAAPGHDAFVYRDRAHTHGFLVRRDRPRFARLFPEMLVTAVRIPFTFGRVRRAYQAAYPDLVSDDYWRSQFG